MFGGEDGEDEVEVKEEPMKFEIQPSRRMEERRSAMEAVCSSSRLDTFLQTASELKVSFHVPKSGSADFVSEQTSEFPVTDLEPKAAGVMAGLGIKRKEAVGMKDTKMSGGTTIKKAKTLSEKRQLLNEQIMKYGITAVEKMYPRQQHQQNSSQPKYFTSRGKISKASPIKMKPKPQGLDFEEIDARKILKPLSHAKYIKEPEYDNVVFIARRKGLVPLASLCKESKTILSTNVRQLQGRNVRLGRPSLYVKDKSDRVLALGGSRSRIQKGNFNILSLPTLVKEQAKVRQVPFEMDDEYAAFATSALIIPPNQAPPPKVDIRTLKKRAKALITMGGEEKDLVLKSKKNIAIRLMQKFQLAENFDVKEASEPVECESESTVEIKIEEECVDNPSHNGTEMKENEIISDKPTEQINQVDESPAKAVPESMEEMEEENKENIILNNSPLHNSWISEIDPLPKADIEKGPIVSQEFAEKFKERKKKALAGVDACDVEECFCKEDDEGNTTSTLPTEAQTPVSGSQTPLQTSDTSPEKTPQKTVKGRLRRVKRALKTLGVKFYEFDDNTLDHGQRDDCNKEFCRMGCICDSISSKISPPTHCGKVECMLRCFCSEDAVKFGSSKKVGISPVGAANLRSNSQRHMAAEERKFHNTVVATSGGDDLVMLGASGRHKRERKLPSRYQDSDAPTSDNIGKEFDSKNNDNDLEDYSAVNPDFDQMKRNHLGETTIKKCNILVPLIEVPSDVKAWCMYHCQYTCPCFKYSNPLDFAPDANEAIEKKVESKKVKGKKTGNQKLEGKMAKDSSPKEHGIDLKEDDTNKKVEKKDITFHMKPAPLCKKVERQKLVRNHCARTAGLVIKPSARIKNPYRFVKRSPKKAEEKKMCTKEKELKKSDGISSSTPRQLNEPTFDISLQEKGKTQYVDWVTFKKNFDQDRVAIYCHIRSKKVFAFVVKSNSPPYVTQAENIKNINQDKYKPLPAAIDALLNHPDDTSGSKFAILTHNGLAWELTGTLKRKKNLGEESGSLHGSDRQTVEANAGDNTNRMSIISTNTQALKLPPGQSVITMQRPGSQNMQIKLPPTDKNQHWSTIRVDNVEGTVQCPDSKMVLKCNVLKQAANLAMKEDTTVRIPISVSGEVSSFGVYAVPGISSHVFVGPFTVNSPAECELICLDSQDDDDIQVISQKKVSKSVNEDSKSQVLSQGSSSSFNSNMNNVLIAGTVPHLVQSVEKGNSEVGDNDDDDDIFIVGEKYPAKKIMAESLMETLSRDHDTKLPYLNIPPSEFGKVVQLSNEGKVDTPSDSMPVQLVTKNLTTTGIKKPNGKIYFPHPKYASHKVFCDSIEDAYNWMKEYETTKLGAPIGSGLKVKPLSELIKQSSTDSAANGMKRAHDVINPDGSRGKAIFLDRKKMKEMTKLYIDLRKAAMPKFFDRNYTYTQILRQATQLILKLRKEEMEYAAQKKTLLRERKNLFSEFSKALDDAPMEVKRQKLLEVKNMVKKRQYKVSDIVDSKPKRPMGPPPLSLKVRPAASQPPQVPQPQIPQPQVPPPLANIGQKPANEQSPNAPVGDTGNPVGSTPYSDVTGLRTVKKDGKVLRPMNAFMLWAKEHRKVLISSGYDGATVSKMLADEWRELSDDQKHKYHLEAEHLKSLHQLQHPDYKYTPRARKNTKRGPSVKGTSKTQALSIPKRIAPGPSKPMPPLHPISMQSLMPQSRPIQLQLGGNIPSSIPMPQMPTPTPPTTTGLMFQHNFQGNFGQFITQNYQQPQLQPHLIQQQQPSHLVQQRLITHESQQIQQEQEKTHAKVIETISLD